MNRALRVRGIIVLLVFLSICALAGLPFLGEQRVDLDVLRDPTGTTRAHLLYWRIRLPRALTAFLAGSGLSAAGLVFQSLFQNDLAGPFTLGVAGGASFAAALYVNLGLAFHIFGIPGISLAAFLGAGLAVAVVIGLTKNAAEEGPAQVLLAGIAVNFSFTGAISFVQYVSDLSGSFRIVRWLMGGLETAGFETVTELFPMIVVGLASTFYFEQELNLITTGEDTAQSRGVDVRRVKFILFLTTSFMLGGVVSFCGPIGFVGLMAPHISRRLVGGDHRRLILTSTLFGGLFLCLCDTAARQIIAPAELPVGVMTSLFGGPFFLWLLVRNRRRHAYL